MDKFYHCIDFSSFVFNGCYSY